MSYLGDYILIEILSKLLKDYARDSSHTTIIRITQNLKNKLTDQSNIPLYRVIF